MDANKRGGGIVVGLACAGLLVLASCASSSRAAGPSQLTPASQPSRPGELTADSTVDEVLDALDARGKDLKDFSATVKLDDMDNSSGEDTINSGKVILQRKGEDDARIRVNFTSKQVEKKIFKVNHEYVLDNGTMVERDYDQKKETRNQVLKPGQKLDLFKLGEGPFPLPLGQKKEDVLNIFEVQKMPADKNDPPGTIHLKLTPKVGTDFAKNYLNIDVWVDLASKMPRRIQTVDVNNTDTRTTDLMDVKINSGVGDKDFDEPALPPGWDMVEGPLGK
jgi:outer membrane lipoprotein-sorting protein